MSEWRNEWKNYLQVSGLIELWAAVLSVQAVLQACLPVVKGAITTRMPLDILDLCWLQPGPYSVFHPPWPLGASSFIPKNVSVSPSWELYTHHRKCAHVLEVKHQLSWSHVLEATEPLEMCICATFTIHIIFSKYYSRGCFKSFLLNHTKNQFPCMLYKELSGPLKVWWKALLFSVRADSCSSKALFGLCLSGKGRRCHAPGLGGRGGVCRREPEWEAFLCWAGFSKHWLSWGKPKALVLIQ